MKFGPSGFRAVLMALMTKDGQISKEIGEEMIQNYEVNELLEWFSAYPRDFGSVHVIVEKLLTDLNFMSPDLERFLREIQSIGDKIV